MMNETGTGAPPGLSEEEASSRLMEEGYNELPSSKRRSIVAIALEVIREPMFLLLVACGAIYLILGDLQEALMLLGFVFVVMGMGCDGLSGSGAVRSCFARLIPL